MCYPFINISTFSFNHFNYVNFARTDSRKKMQARHMNMDCLMKMGMRRRVISLINKCKGRGHAQTNDDKAQGTEYD